MTLLFAPMTQYTSSPTTLLTMMTTDHPVVSKLIEDVEAHPHRDELINIMFEQILDDDYQV